MNHMILMKKPLKSEFNSFLAKNGWLLIYILFVDMPRTVMSERNEASGHKVDLRKDLSACRRQFYLFNHFPVTKRK